MYVYMFYMLNMIMNIILYVMCYLFMIKCVFFSYEWIYYIRIHYELLDFGEVQFGHKNLFLPCITCGFVALNIQRLHNNFQHTCDKNDTELLFQLVFSNKYISSGCHQKVGRIEFICIHPSKSVLLE